MPRAMILPPKVVTRALRGVEHCQPGALDELWRLVYPWVVQRAQALLHRDTVRFEIGEPEDLAHEAFLKLKPAHLGMCRDRKHLIRIATRAMRQALVDRARRLRCRGRTTQLHASGVHEAGPAPDLEGPLDLALALDALQAVNARTAEVATLHLLAGLNFVELGRVLGMSEAWSRMVWGQAESWLRSRWHAS